MEVSDFDVVSTYVKRFDKRVCYLISKGPRRSTGAIPRLIGWFDQGIHKCNLSDCKVEIKSSI